MKTPSTITKNQFLKISSMTGKVAHFPKIIILAFCAFFLVSCQNGNSFYKLSKEDRNNNKYTGHYKVGDQYQIKGQTYTPQKYKKYEKVGHASWYGLKKGFHGKKTANGDTYNKEMLTAAHRTLNLPCLVKVKNLENNKSVIVMVNDRGPFSKNREIDVSERAASILGFKRKGTAKVKVEYLHAETEKMLKTLGLEKKEGSRSRKQLANKKCSVNCHIKLVNLKHGIDVNV